MLPTHTLVSGLAIKDLLMPFIYLQIYGLICVLPFSP